AARRGARGRAARCASCLRRGRRRRRHLARLFGPAATIDYAMRPVLLFAMAVSAAVNAFDLQGHRGARGHAPENTLPGFERALAIGVTTLELDVGVTRDGVVVIHHDRRLNSDITRGPDGRWIASPAGPLVSELTFEELQRYDVGRIRPGSEYAQRFPRQKPVDGARVPRLADLFAKAGNTVRFNIEMKIA